MRKPSGWCGGFTLVSAVFLLVVITTAVAFTVRIVGMTRASVSFSWQGARAYRAALSGLEWGSYQALQVPGTCPGPPTTNQFTLTEGGLVGFEVTVVCASDIHVDGATTHTRYHITATGEWRSFGDRDYVSRRVETTIGATL